MLWATLSGIWIAVILGTITKLCFDRDVDKGQRVDCLCKWDGIPETKVAVQVLVVKDGLSVVV